MADISVFAAAPYTTSAGAAKGSTADDRRRSEWSLIVPIVSAAALLLMIDLSIALRWQGEANASATLVASAVGLLAGPIRSDACRGSDSRLDRTAMQVLLSAP
jgi:hypothetical protein